MYSIGFCTVSPKANGKGIKEEQKTSFNGKICQIQEISDDGSMLVLNETGTALGMFEKDEILNHFLCDLSYSGFVLPPKLGFLNKMLYVNKLTQRKGGYNNLLKQMVIVSSLHKGEYNDNFLFQIENAENAEQLRKQKTK